MNPVLPGNPAVLNTFIQDKPVNVQTDSRLFNQHHIFTDIKMNDKWGSGHDKYY